MHRWNGVQAVVAYARLIGNCKIGQRIEAIGRVDFSAYFAKTKSGEMRTGAPG